MTTENPRWAGERAWAKQQLLEAETTEAETELIMSMLEAWWDGTADDVWRALGIFEQLARGKALEPIHHVTAVWQQARPGRLTVRDYVRVKLDAYKGQTGREHNGRSGPIVAIRSGDIIVRYDDGKGPVPETGVRHSPHSLEKRVFDAH